MEDFSLYEKVILPSLYEEGYSVLDICDYDKEYIVTYNPLTTDENTRSCMIFKQNGNLKLFNGTYSTKEGEEFTTTTLTTWLRKLKCGLKYYISYKMYALDIDKTILYDLIEYVKNKLLNIPQKYNKKFEDIRKTLYKHYILDIDLLSIGKDFELNIKRLESSEKPKQLESKTEIVESSQHEKNAIQEYLKSRGINIPLNGSGNILCRTIIQNEIYRKPAVCFAYEDGFYKYRLIYETQKQYRFRSSGRYSNFFNVRKNGSDILYVVEGDIEGLSIKQFIEDDIVVMHNTNSLPSKCDEVFAKYKKIIIKIDKDRFEENKGIFLKSKFKDKIIVDYKLEEENIDYNDLLVKNLLTKEIIEKINRKERD